MCTLIRTLIVPKLTLNIHPTKWGPIRLWMVHISFVGQIFPIYIVMSGLLEFAAPPTYPATGYVRLSNTSRILGAKVDLYACSK